VAAATVSKVSVVPSITSSRSVEGGCQPSHSQIPEKIGASWKCVQPHPGRTRTEQVLSYSTTLDDLKESI